LSKAALIVSPDLWKAGHGPTHPLKPIRLKRTFDLLNAYHAFDQANSRTVAPRMASDEELAWFHTPEYVAAVKRLSRGDLTVPAGRFRLGAGDNPIFAGMYESEALKVGGGLVAVELISNGEADCVFNYAGGLHHAASDHASGFCVFNDPVITIQGLLRHGWRVAYIDIDAHHGDGVQNAFYDSDQVLTVSMHESGMYLFPGTGFTAERGKGKGFGLALNVPLPPYTWDEPYVSAFRAVVAPVVIATFKTRWRT
jgi:acetoin utilization protein AcuC